MLRAKRRPAFAGRWEGGEAEYGQWVVGRVGKGSPIG